MDVYLIPLASDRYELYCEPADESEDARHESESGFFAGLAERFRVMLTRLERHQAADSLEREPRGWTRRVRDRAMRWVAEKVAEQRLLWRLRKHSTVRAFSPGDLSASQATTVIRRLLQRDADRHQRWMIFHLVATLFAAVVLGPLFLVVPGVANLPAAYFAFRLLGHYLSMRGARHGLNRVTWTYAPCDPLTHLRRVRSLPVSERARYVGEIASGLRLTHLPRFFKRTADWGA